MKDSKSCSMSGHWWSCRYEMVGVFFLILATILTLITLNGFGIAAMFFVGLILCSQKYFSCGVCHSHAIEDDVLHTDVASQIKPHVRKAVAKKKDINKM